MNMKDFNPKRVCDLQVGNVIYSYGVEYKISKINVGTIDSFIFVDNCEEYKYQLNNNHIVYVKNPTNLNTTPIEWCRKYYSEIKETENYNIFEYKGYLFRCIEGGHTINILENTIFTSYILVDCIYGIWISPHIKNSWDEFIIEFDRRKKESEQCKKKNTTTTSEKRWIFW